MIRIFSNSVSEVTQYVPMIEDAIATVNPPSALRRGKKLRLPEAVVADSALGYPQIHKWNTEHGIATITTWRDINDGRSEPTDLPFVDRHAVLRCQHCGGPGKFVELRLAQNETPRVYYQCGLPAHPTSPCAKQQSIACSKDWRLVGHLWHDDPRYIALDARRWPGENTHHRSRTRSKVGPKTIDSRPKRLGRDWQQLRASLSVLRDWLRAAAQQGWLASSRSAWRGYSAITIAKMREWREHERRKAEATRRELIELRHREGLDSTVYQPSAHGP